MTRRPIVETIDSPRALAGRRVVVMGLGLHGGGLGVAQFLRAHGASLVVTDLRRASELAPSVEQLGTQGVRYVLGRHDLQDFREAEIVVRNPAVPLDAPALAVAREAGARIEMELTMFLRWCAASQVVAVTGTRGKSTTAAALHAMLRAGGRPARLAGNMGVSALAQLDQIQRDEVVVLEMSSWQTEGLAGTGVRVSGAVITNLLPDHLNRYASMEAYAAAKAELLGAQRTDDWAVLPAGPGWGDWFAARARGRVVRVPPEAPPPGWRNAVLRGAHNRANLAAAALAARELGVPTAAVDRAVATFPGVAQRQEFLGTIGSVRVFNDTTATIPDATLAALDTIPGPWVLIAGGSDKRLDFDRLAERLERDPGVRGVVLLPGTGTDRLRPLLRASAPAVVGDMTAAVGAALDMAQPGDALLLSPACASFGLFVHEFDRGAQFVAAVETHGLTPPARQET